LVSTLFGFSTAGVHVGTCASPFYEAIR